MMIAQIVRSLAASWLAQRVYPLPWAYSFTLKTVICVIVTGIVARGFIEDWGGRWAVAVTYLLVASGLCLCFWRRKMTTSARARVLSMVGSFRI